MPNSTYFNLPEEKKNKIRDRIYKLFIENDYTDIGIRDIANALEISVGCFYRYFEGKDDMYLFFFKEIEEKIFAKEYELIESFLERNPYVIDMGTFLSAEEITFNNTWYFVPAELVYKYYFEGYGKKIAAPILSELEELYKKDCLNPNLTADFAFHLLVTFMFNFLTYVKTSLLKTPEEIALLKKEYFETVVFKSILSDEFYNETFKKDN